MIEMKNKIEKYKKLFNILNSDELEILLKRLKTILKTYEKIDIDKRSRLDYDYAIMNDTTEKIQAILELQKERSVIK